MSKPSPSTVPALPKLKRSGSPGNSGFDSATDSNTFPSSSPSEAVASAAVAKTSASPVNTDPNAIVFRRSWDPVFKKKGQHLSGLRKPLPKPDSLAGKAYACYKKYADRYNDIVNSFHEEFTQQARADAEQAERERLVAIQPPSIPESPRILASLEDLIDVCRSRVHARKELRVRKLIKDNELDVNAQSKMYGGWTALIAAARSGSYRTVRALCDDFGADVNLTERHGWTALIHAANKGHLRIVKFLCENHRATALFGARGEDNALQYARSPTHGGSMYLSGDTPRG